MVNTLLKINMMLFGLLIFCSVMFGQDEAEFPQVAKNNFSNCEIVTSKYYKGEALWGLINGGADVYLEYGFNKLLFQEIKWENKNYRIEIYKMKGPESAFGIYSISKYKCNNNLLNRFICITPYQVQGCRGNFYISITNEVGDSITQEATHKIYDVIENQISRAEIQISLKIQHYSDLDNHSNLKFINGPLGLQNGFPRWSNLFERLENFSFYLLESTINEEPVILAEIKIENKKEEDLLLNNLEDFKDNLHIKKLTNGNIFIVDGAISKEKRSKIFK